MAVMEEERPELLTESAIKGMTCWALREALRERGAGTRGLKKELQARLRELESARRGLGKPNLKRDATSLISSDFDANDATCQVCLDWMRDAVYQCREGHTVCGECFGKMTRRRSKRQCPTCRTPMEGIRNRALESVLAGAKMPCRWVGFGCGECLPKNGRTVHESTCEYLAFECPDSVECGHSCLAAEMSSHMWTSHKRKLRLVTPGVARLARFTNARPKSGKVRSCLCSHDDNIFALVVLFPSTGGAWCRAFCLRKSHRKSALSSVKIAGLAPSDVSIQVPIEDATDLCLDQLRDHLAVHARAQDNAFFVPQRNLPGVVGDAKELKLRITFLSRPNDPNNLVPIARDERADIAFPDDDDHDESDGSDDDDSSDDSDDSGVGAGVSSSTTSSSSSSEDDDTGGLTSDSPSDDY